MTGLIQPELAMRFETSRNEPKTFAYCVLPTCAYCGRKLSLLVYAIFLVTRILIFRYIIWTECCWKNSVETLFWNKQCFFVIFWKHETCNWLVISTGDLICTKKWKYGLPAALNRYRMNYPTNISYFLKSGQKISNNRFVRPTLQAWKKSECISTKLKCVCIRFSAVNLCLDYFYRKLWYLGWAILMGVMKYYTTNKVCN